MFAYQIAADWQKRRSKYNHDWLKNQYLTALGSWLNLLDNKIVDHELEASFILEILPQWESTGRDAALLASDFELQMSPRCLFSYPPLSKCDDNTSPWLGQVVHHLWIERCGVKALVEEVLLGVEKANTAYDRFNTILQHCKNVQSIEKLRPYREQFLEFRSCCQHLAKSIEKFPSEVKVV